MNKLSLIQKIQRFFKLESAGGILLLFSAVVAMLLANSPLNQMDQRWFYGGILCFSGNGSQKRII